VRLGASAATEPDILRALAADDSVTVRAALALNPAAPPQADAALARDADERVRILLARKLGALAPNLSDPARVRLRQQTYATLAALVADEAVRVRAAIAEELKHIPDAPREIILRLAQDQAVMVCEPIILFSPMLTPQDLVALVAAASSPATVAAVARRAEIDESVSDAIAATADGEAIRALLGNRSAHIREATLDALITRGVEHVDWHEPLVRRPVLPPRAARALSGIVATHLLEVLSARSDLDPRLSRELQARLAARLAASAVPAAEQAAAGCDSTLDQARALAAAGKLDEEAVLDAARRGEARLGAALLAVAAGVPIAVVDRAASLRSAKGLVSLTWKAGFSMRAAGALQTLLARLAPEAALSAGQGGGFPLAVEEMRWQLDFLGGVGR
jgi:uncharacterized protein (DUF2336 family)